MIIIMRTIHFSSVPLLESIPTERGLQQAYTSKYSVHHLLFVCEMATTEVDSLALACWPSAVVMQYAMNAEKW
jgi:hypothetical protein